MNNKIKSKIIKPHSKDCRSKHWSGVLKGEPFYGNYAANKEAKNGRHHYWYVISCNDPNCEGEKAVHSSVLSEA